MHDLTFVTPALIALAAPKIYTHRIVLASSRRERSLLYGSDGPAVEDYLRRVTAETLVERVVGRVKCPR